MNFVEGINRDQLMIIDFKANVSTGQGTGKAQLILYYFSIYKHRIQFFPKLLLVNLKR